MTDKTILDTRRIVLARIPPDQLVDILDIAEDGIVTVDVRQEIVLFNRGAAKLFGYEPEEIVGLPLITLIPARFCDAHAGQITEFGRSPAPARVMGERRAVCGRRKDGSEFPAEVSISKLNAGNDMLFTAIVRDVTERKRYEAAQRELEHLRAKARFDEVENAARAAETQFRRIVETANEGIWELNAEARITFVNDRMAQMVGYSPSEMIGRKKWDFLFDEDQATVRALFERRRAGISEQADVRFRHYDGRAIWIMMSARPVIDELGGFRGCLDMFTDITERVRAEIEVRESQSFTRSVLDSLPAQIAVLDAAGTITAVNAAWERFGEMHGAVAQRSGVGTNYLEICRTADGPFAGEASQVERGLRNVLEGIANRFILEYPCPSPTRDMWFVLLATPLRSDRRGVVVTHYEITERKEAESRVEALAVQREHAMIALQSKTDELRTTTQQLWQAARLAGVGELAASIAHELNNPLGTVALRIETLLAKTAQDDARRRPLEIVEQEVERMAGLVSNLLQFSRAGREQISTVDVAEEIMKTIELVAHHLRKQQVRVVPEFDSDVTPIHADRQQLRQVFLNLFTNASDAMPEGGCLSLRVRRGNLDSSKPSVVIEAADTGVGIPSELIGRVFEPFFTTKDEGKGTGLGLAICRRIVQQHHGVMEIDSRQGSGTTVRITLPVRPDTNVAALHTL
jgi:PAS domain S-box-containing protein